MRDKLLHRFMQTLFGATILCCIFYSCAMSADEQKRYRMEKIGIHEKAVDLPEEMNAAEQGDILKVYKVTGDSIYVGFPGKDDPAVFYDGEGNRIPDSAVKAFVRKHFVESTPHEDSLISKYFY